MSTKLFRKILKHKFITGIVLLFIIAGGYFGYKTIGSDGQALRYTLAAAEKGALIVSVSGSGQVTVLDQVDVKPEVSGDVVGVYFNKDQEVKAGQLLAELDAKSAQQAIDDAEIALDDAKEKLTDLVSPPDAQSLRQAEVALAQAERDLNEAKESYENIEADTEDSLTAAYEDGYDTVAAAFLKLPNYISDLKDVLGTEKYELDYISGYELVLGKGSSFIQRALDDYYQVIGPFNKNHMFFITVFKNDERDIIYQLIGETLETTRVISRALDSARHMYDAAVLNEDYKRLSIASQIDKMKVKIESDASAVSSIINSLQQIKDDIDETIKNIPKKVEDAEWALQSAQDKFDEKKLALEELLAGADSKEVRSQENVVLQKENALLDAKEKLNSCFIRAPFDAVIAEKNDKVKKGDSVSSNTVLATLITKQKIAGLALNEIDAAKVKTGQKVTLTFDALPEVVATGKVSEIETIGQVSQGVVSYGIKIAFDIDIEQVKPGMSVTADIITEAKTDVLTIPSSAIKYQGNSYYVELVETPEEERQQLLASISGTILPEPPKQQPVEIGLSNDISTEIISGIKEGDIVVASTISSNNIQTTQTRETQGFSIPGMSGSGAQMRSFSR